MFQITEDGAGEFYTIKKMQKHSKYCAILNISL